MVCYLIATVKAQWAKYAYESVCVYAHIVGLHLFLHVRIENTNVTCKELMKYHCDK
jgi:hypothetical protein